MLTAIMKNSDGVAVSKMDDIKDTKNNKCIPIDP
jgi:hypothetical protein